MNQGLEKNDGMSLIIIQSKITLNTDEQVHVEEYESCTQLEKDQINKKDNQQDNLQFKEILSLIHKPYEILNEFSKEQSEDCRAIAFNMDQTIMIAGCNNKITVFDFENGLLNQKQLLSDHKNVVLTLYFMKRQNQFISGANKEIGIWNYNNASQQYYCLQMLKQAHLSHVNRVIMNKNEDLIISCSFYETIKFWMKENQWECHQTLIYDKNWVMDVCLNDSCTQLVSCNDKGQILISQQGDDQRWRKIQRIQSNRGCRICYINDNIIAFQPEKESYLETYQLQQQTKQFIKYKNISIQNDIYYQPWFPMQFNKKKQLLITKNGFRINLIRIKNNDFIIEQSINFGTQSIWGAMTDDFQYLVTYDRQSQELQVRKQK